MLFNITVQTLLVPFRNDILSAIVIKLCHNNSKILMFFLTCLAFFSSLLKIKRDMMLPNTVPLAPASFPDNFSNLEFHSSRLMGRILLDWIRIENSQRSKEESPE